MREVSAYRANLWADGVHATVGCKSPPVDLCAVARQQKVMRACLRLMIHRGALMPVRGGFELFLRSVEPRDLALDAPEPARALTTRQRFTFAHEIAHTYFYTTASEIPATAISSRQHLLLEKACDSAAARLLAPTNLLRSEVRNRLGDREKIDASFARNMAKQFNVSPEVMLGRLSSAEADNAFTRCLAVVRTIGGKPVVTASYVGMSMLSATPPPKKFSPAATWFKGFPLDLEAYSTKPAREVTVGDRRLIIEANRLGRSGDFLVQIDDAVRPCPRSE
jgi:hypothetical protein